MSRPEIPTNSSALQFECVALSKTTAEEWIKYFLDEQGLCSDIHQLCWILPIIASSDNIEKIRDNLQNIVPNCIITFKTIFGNEVIDDITQFEKAINFLKKMQSRIHDFRDPISNSIRECRPEVYPKGLWMASVKSNNSVIISVLVVPFEDKEDKKAQTHKFIFKSLRFLLKQHMESLKPITDISLPLHAFAAKTLGSEYVITRPMYFMEEILRKAGFQSFPSIEEETLTLGESTRQYMRKYGVGDVRYPLMYHKNTPELQEIYSAYVSSWHSNEVKSGAVNPNTLFASLPNTSSQEKEVPNVSSENNDKGTTKVKIK